MLKILKFTVDVNMNDMVQVKMTDYGWELYMEEINPIRVRFKSVPYTLESIKQEKEDAEGYSKWQLWTLFRHFGEHINLGARSPFGMDIRIVEEKI